MAGQRRGFARERHTAMKAAVSLLSVAGFALSWFALHEGHAPRTGTLSTTPRPSAASASGDQATRDLSTPTRRARTSRGS